MIKEIKERKIKVKEREEKRKDLIVREVEVKDKKRKEAVEEIFKI